MEYKDRKTGLIMYSSWWKSGKDFLKSHAIITQYGSRIGILKQNIILLQNGWKEIKPVEIKVKCLCTSCTS